MVILSHTHLSVCSDLLTLRASPRAIPPLSLIPFQLRLCLNNIKIYKILSSEIECVHSGQLRQNHENQGWKNIIYRQIQSLFTQYLMNASLFCFDIIIFDK